VEHGQTVKIVGASGQISLGKKYAGQTVLMENIAEGVWLLKLAKVIRIMSFGCTLSPKRRRSMKQFPGLLKIHPRKPIWRV
jgi:hypothetical protein